MKRVKKLQLILETEDRELEWNELLEILKHRLKLMYDVDVLESHWDLVEIEDLSGITDEVLGTKERFEKGQKDSWEI